MRKLFPILLLCLLLFNMMGFSVYSLLENTSTTGLQRSGSDQLIVKVPISLPYVTDWESSGDQEGELLHDESYYQITSKKISNDTLYLACQFDESARDRFWELVSNFDDHVKKSQDHRKDHTGNVMKNLLKEYMSTGRKLIFYIIEWVARSTYITLLNALPTSTTSVSTPPPNPA